MSRFWTRLMDRSDLEPMAPGARQVEKRKDPFSDVWTGARRMR
ncbi:hypothetical protein [Alkalihalobacterium chitinilyticum]|uniref:Uncharacterized protein n=1 Tax=Alkalihalobacterium chitinilyticum TaxID=2980103 RepID=A0ABT5V9F1_9BACI|nr:hypothetical protein [Alkalihalobacterium chitinilyticum]MDE5411962.1 hypothetical protein [Alkalihalobacterium chitinilyticum]